jgi:hypothetical protein
MANQKVTQLPAANTSNDADLLYVVQGTTSRKTTKQLLMASTLAVANAAASTANAATATANAAANTANNALSQVGTAVQKTGDTMTGDLDMGNNQIENLGTPFGPADATTKTYVDTADALKLDKSGGTMTGALNMGSQGLTNLTTPSASTDAATKGYVDTGLTAKLDKSGGTMTGGINMGSQGLSNLITPVSSTDAATKGYVDTALVGKQNTVATTTGVAVALVTPQEYGSYGTPETGNISVSLTSAVRGIDQIVYHDDTVAPTIVVAGGTAIKFGPIDYSLTKVNIIVFWFMGGTNVGYIITPAV